MIIIIIHTAMANIGSSVIWRTRKIEKSSGGFGKVNSDTEARTEIYASSEPRSV